MSIDFATQPLHTLLEKDVSKMSREELNHYTILCRQLRTTPPTFTKLLRDDPEIEDITKKEKRTPATPKGPSLLAMLAATQSQPQPQPQP